METPTLEEMYKRNDEEQNTIKEKIILCTHVLQAIDECSHWKNMNSGFKTKFEEIFPKEYITLNFDYSENIRVYTYILGELYDFHVYFDISRTWEGLRESTEKIRQQFLDYLVELEEEKKLYPTLIEKEKQIKALQDEIEKMDVSMKGKEFFPRSFCSDCRYNRISY